MIRVFVSSTCHDLIDLRAEVREHIRILGFEPVLSDIPETFDVGAPIDSIRTCLANVDGSDIFVCILSRRYGPRLKDFGFDDVSAMHLEYRHARKRNKKILFYVRDRLLAALDAWKAAGNAFSKRHPWLEAHDAAGLQELLDEQSKLATAQERSNWYSIFRDSVELRKQLTNHLESESAVALLERLSEQGRLPQFAISWPISGPPKIFLRNVGAIAAHDVEILTKGVSRLSINVVEPGFAQYLDLQLDGDATLAVRWRDPAGVAVEDVFRLAVDGRAVLDSRRLRARSSIRFLGPSHE